MNSNDERFSKPKLIPVTVPWKIAVATPFLRVVVSEFEERTVEFAARFLGEGDDDDYERMVIVTFEGAGWLKVSPAQSEGDIVDETAYDWSEVKLRPQSAENVQEWIRIFHQQWRTSGFCPDPGMYEVKNSNWLKVIPRHKLGYKHCLILGEEMYVEVLCKAWNWSEGEKLDWSSE